MEASVPRATVRCGRAAHVRLAAVWHDRGVDPLAAAEAAYLDAREAWDRHGIAVARGEPAEELERDAVARTTDARTALAAVAESEDAEDRRALATMRGRLPSLNDADDAQIDTPLARAFADATERLLVDGTPLARLAILGKLAREPDPGRRRELFLALEPCWTAVDGDGSAASPYRAMLAHSAARWATDGSPIAANAAALGIAEPEIERWCIAILDAWRDATAGTPSIEPWDWWWAAGVAERRLAAAIPVERLLEITIAYGRALGADPDALGIRFDVHPRPSRQPVTVAYTEFGARPRARPDGSWATGAPWVFASYTAGGLGELTELIHELGHAIHIAAIRTRPAFTDWPDSDALSEAIAEIPALDTAEPAWQRRWLGADAPEVDARAAIRGRYADVAMDAAWALFEIRLHADPRRRPNDVWTEITGDWLGIAPHPEWSWWAIRGQLVDAPGYMANYAVGAVLASDLRAALQRDGGWLAGDPGWYGRVSDRLFRFGLERPSGAVIRDVVGRTPDPQALVTEIARMRSPHTYGDAHLRRSVGI
jgi:hypothetical protein